MLRPVFPMSLPMAFQLEGARVLVTAGASGIGLATARAFAQHFRVAEIMFDKRRHLRLALV